MLLLLLLLLLRMLMLLMLMPSCSVTGRVSTASAAVQLTPATDQNSQWQYFAPPQLPCRCRCHPRPLGYVVMLVSTVLLLMLLTGAR